MVFSSVPAYLDPDPIWQHHHQQQSESGGDHESAHVPVPPPLPARGGGGGGSTTEGISDTSKPGPVSNRAKLAKLSQPHIALKCPRCESTNTKFCYFNNYNLSQPRHFCKTCRRYWTRGGALRNVPVGGGCRRNKRSKSSGRSSKSAATSLASVGALLTPNSSRTTDHINLGGHLTLPSPKLPFSPSLHHLTDHHYGTFGGNIQSANGSTAAGNDIDRLIQIGKFSENWRLHQYSPYLETPSPNTGIYQFDQMSELGVSNYGGAVTSDDHNCDLGSRTVLDSAVAQVVDDAHERVLKMEDNNKNYDQYQGLNLSKKLLGISDETEDQYMSWGSINSNAWTSTNASEFASSSSTY